MPLRKFFAGLMSPDATSDMLSEMVSGKATPDAVLSAALGISVGSISDVLENNPNFSGAWLALEIARRHVLADLTVKAVKECLREQIDTLRAKQQDAVADELQRCVDALSLLVTPKCEHEWATVAHPISRNIRAGTICAKCHALRLVY